MWQLKSRTPHHPLLAAPSIELVTTELPMLHRAFKPHELYETALFVGDDSEVLKRHEKRQQAVDFHEETAEELHLVPAA